MIKTKAKYINLPIKILVLLGLLIGAMCCVYNALSWKDTTGGYLSSYTQLYNLEEDTVDVLFVGSSHAYCDIYPCYLWRDYGIASFDMAVSGQDKDSSYYSVIEALKTQKPKVVCVEMYGLLFDKHEVLGNEYRNMLGMRMSRNSYSLVKKYSEEDKTKKKNYLLRWPIIHTRYKELQKYDFDTFKPSIYGKGADFHWEIGVCNYDENAAEIDEVGELGKKNQEWIDRLQELSYEKGFSLVLFMAPHWTVADDQKIINAASKYAAGKGIPFFDINANREMIGLNYEMDYLDSFHLNAYGAEKMTAYMHDILTTDTTASNGVENEKLNLADHRGDAQYDSWNLDLEDYEHLKAKIQLQQVADAAEYIQKVGELGDMTIIASLEGDMADRDYNLAMNSLGVAEESWRQGGKWIWKDGEVISYMPNALELSTVYDFNQTDSMRIQYLGDLSEQNLMIGDESYSNHQNGLSIVVYDNLREEVFGQKEF